MQNASISPAYNRIPSDGVTPFVMQIDDSLRFPTAGCRYFRVLAATAALHIRFDDGPEIPMRAGMSYRAPVNFSWVTITNRSGAANTMDVVWSDGEITDGAMTVTAPINIANAIETIRGASILHNADVSIAGGSSTQFYGGGSTVMELLISNSSTNLYPFRIGGWNPVNSGCLLDPGDTIRVKLTGAISAYNHAPYPQSISFTRINK